MSDQSHDHFSHHVRRYLFVFYALLFGTLITVAASYIPFGVRSINIAVALFIAIAKASLVACCRVGMVRSEEAMVRARQQLEEAISLVRRRRPS